MSSGFVLYSTNETLSIISCPRYEIMRLVNRNLCKPHWTIKQTQAQLELSPLFFRHEILEAYSLGTTLNLKKILFTITKIRVEILHLSFSLLKTIHLYVKALNGLKFIIGRMTFPQRSEMYHYRIIKCS
jgi:hypothetical protein